MTAPSSPSRVPRWLGYFLLFLGASAISIALSTSYSRPQLTSESVASYRAGGATTFVNRSSHAYGQPAPGLNEAELALHAEGDVTFGAVFVTSPAPVNPGLGPKFNGNSCEACHLKNGRGLPQLGQALIRTSLPATNGRTVVKTEGVVPDPVLGGQLQDNAVYGEQPEAKVAIEWAETTGRYADGEGYGLRSPKITINAIDSEHPISEGLLTSLRIPPAVFGVGLLEAIPEETLSAIADPEDKNKDGISGRINRVWDFETEQLNVGRFGLKANSPTLISQTAAAYANDMGITNHLFSGEDGAQDISPDDVKASAFYTQTLAVPARSQSDSPAVQRGEKLFAEANCAACHLSKVRTGDSPVKTLANQNIAPYTDLLLHDMGEGLADGRPDFEADGQEWRTTPLWGLGLVQTVLPYAGYLHDGRARTVEEAVLWHGGEAEASKESFVAMAKDDRQAMLTFLNSL